MGKGKNTASDQGEKPIYRDKNLKIIFLITLMAVLGVSSITPAFPSIIKELKITVHSVGLLIIIFTLPAIFFTPLLGIVADRFGRKNVLIPSLILFGLAGTACGFVTSFKFMLVFRFFQGIGAASLGSINVTLIGDLFTGNKRAKAMGYNSGVLSIATASYPFLGGLLANFKWNYPFFLPVLAIPIVLIVISRLDNPEISKQENLRQYFKKTYKVIKERQTILFFMISMATFIILYGSYITYFPMFLKKNFDLSPLMIGITMSFMSIVTGITSSQFGKLPGKISKTGLLKISFLIYSVSLLIFPFITRLWMMAIPLALFGIAHGINIPCLQTLLVGIAPVEYRAAVMSINGMALRVGQTLGPLLMGLIYLAGNINYTFYGGSIVALIVFSILYFFIKSDVTKQWQMY